MRVAITGGTGFVGRQLARRLVGSGHEVVLIARGVDGRDPSIFAEARTSLFAADLSSVSELERAFAGCDVVMHCAGINREAGKQTYRAVHIEGTRNVCEAAKRVGVRKLMALSFLRARPDCGSAYHESKFAAEEIVRGAGLDYTVFKAGVIYGLGDHMLDHLSHALHTFPIFALVGMKQHPARPLAVEDLTSLMQAAINDARLARKTIAVTGPDEMKFPEMVRRVATVIGKKPLMFRAPLALHYALAWVAERTMKIPLTSMAQVRILSETLSEPLPPCDAPPADLALRTFFTAAQIQRGLPAPARFGLKDLRWHA
jgi:NADH dehydrogenase